MRIDFLHFQPQSKTGFKQTTLWLSLIKKQIDLQNATL